MQQLFDIQALLLEQFNQLDFFQRRCFDEIALNNRITGLLGARGIGKTTFLLLKALEHGALEQKALYISADSYYLLNTPLIELVDKLYKETDVRLLCIDEVQKYHNWNQELKNIFDTYRDFKVLFTGSSMIDLVRAKYDLSRRVTMYHLHGLSFREYLAFSQNISLPVIVLDDLLNNHQSLDQEYSIPQVLKHFNDYCRVGYYPFFKELKLEQEKFQAIENAVQKTIYEDIATLHSLKTSTMLTIEKLYKFVVNSQPGEHSAFKLSNVLSKDFSSITEYLQMLEQAGLIRFVYARKSGKTMLRSPAKMMPENTNLIFSSFLPQNLDEVRGKVRETFVINHLHNSNHQHFLQ
jgi:hypothetical protein